MGNKQLQIRERRNAQWPYWYDGDGNAFTTDDFGSLVAVANHGRVVSSLRKIGD